MPITLEQAKELKKGTYVYQKKLRWKVSGVPKTWKSDPSKVRVPIKHGLYTNGYLTEQNIDSVSLGE